MSETKEQMAARLEHVSELPMFVPEAVAALRAGAQALREPQWQDISTAPIGVSVLLWKPNTREIYVAARIHGGAGLGWCTPDGHEIFKATHWMPLPPAPSEDQ